jgi:hypothetical protein
MLMVAPRGKTDPATDFSIPKFFSAHEIVTGKVAFDEEDE